MVGIYKITSPSNKIYKNNRDIICINTGQNFNSIRQCAEEMGFNERGIGNVLTGYAQTYKKFKFKYIN